MLTEHEIRIVQDDWRKVELIADQAATLLYDRVFAIDPSTRLLFPGDMQVQKRKLMNMIGAAIFGLSRPDILTPIVGLLGRKHVDYGVQDRDYETVRQALLWTLRQGLGAEFGPENEAVWNKVYDVLAATMRSAPTSASA